LLPSDLERSLLIIGIRIIAIVKCETRSSVSRADHLRIDLPSSEKVFYFA